MGSIAIAVQQFGDEESRPRTPAWTVFNQITRAIRNIEQGPSIVRPGFVATNGQIAVSEPDPRDAKFGSFTAPAMYIFPRQNTGSHDGIEATTKIFEEMTKLLPVAFGAEIPLAKEQTTSDVAYPTLPDPPEDKILISMVEDDVLIQVDEDWFYRQCRALQRVITETIIRIRGPVQLAIIGLGTLGRHQENGGLTVTHRPGYIIKLTDEVGNLKKTLEAYITEVDYMKAGAVNHAFYAYLAATMLERLLTTGSTKSITGMEIEDWVAYINVLSAQYQGIGNLDTVKHYDAEDIFENIIHTIGIGINPANRFQFGVLDKQENQLLWTRYIYFCILFSLFMDRAKPQVQEMKVRKRGGHFYDYGTVWEEASKCHYKDFGSRADIYFLMAKKLTRDREMFDLYFPMMVRDLDTDNKVIENDYTARIRTSTPVSFRSVTLDERGGYPVGTFKPTDIATNLKITVMEQTRIYVRRLEYRTLRMWLLPTARNIYKNSISEVDRKVLYVVGLLSGGAATLRDGYLAPANYGVIEPIRIKYYITELGELRVVKEKTSVKGTAEVPYPGTGSGLAAVAEDVSTTKDESAQGRVDIIPPTEPKIESPTKPATESVTGPTNTEPAEQGK